MVGGAAITGAVREPRPDLRARRLDLAGTREFTAAGAGAARRAAVAAETRAWLTDLYRDTVGPLPGLALAAVGSLGRGDSGPLSDLDLVLLHDGRSVAAGTLARLSDQLWYPVWDSGLRLDHSVRSTGECRQVAADDLAAAVGLLDLSLVAGDPDLVASVRSTVAHDWRAGARSRLPSFVEALRARHHRHGELAQQVEPDLKEAAGGLRDATVLRALTGSWLTDRSRGDTDEAIGHLHDVRDAIHVVTGRGRDRLLRDDHDAVAALLGLDDADDLLTGVSTAARRVAWSLESTLRRASQSQRARILRVGPRRPTMVPLGHGAFRHDGEVVLGSTSLVGHDPRLALRVAGVAARAGLPLAPRTLHNLAASPGPEPWDERGVDLLVDLLAAGPGLLPVWEGLDHVGVVERWLPEWAAVRGRPQRHPVHRHTVERHLLETVLRAQSFRREVSRPDLLLLAALLHDIGKVAGARDHSLRGAEIADGLLRRLGLPDADRETVVLLVREHLSLVEIATRRDLEDPSTLAHVLDIVRHDAQTFELLRALTIADARAAGPAAWTDWRATLLDVLTARVREALTGLTPPVPPPPTTAPDVDPAVLAEAAAGRPHVTVDPAPGGWRVTVHARDRVGLFADTAGLLAAYGLTVRRARLHTVDDVAVDEWLVESSGGDAPEPRRIAAGLVRLHGGDRAVLAALRRRRGHGRASAPLTGGARAFVVPTAARGATVVEVRAEDRPGLLHDVGRALAEQGLDVRSAHVSTHAGQTLDTFYLTDPSGRAPSPGRVARLVGALIDACDGAVSTVDDAAARGG